MCKKYIMYMLSICLCIYLFICGCAFISVSVDVNNSDHRRLACAKRCSVHVISHAAIFPPNHNCLLRPGTRGV